MNIEHSTPNSPKASKHLSASGGSNVEIKKPPSRKHENISEHFVLFRFRVFVIHFLGLCHLTVF